ncbi:MAG: vanadium-dependent haloperoxidase [Flavobacteriaceae bacterium]|nr:vanadium-dependent haloperoxidase [Flavobacteriaceae bacterium]
MHLPKSTSSINKLTTFSLLAMSLFACKEPEPIPVSATDFQNSVDHVTSIMVHDIFSPPVASRIYAYPNIAAHEIIAQQDSSMSELALSIKHLNPVPKGEDPMINYPLAALIAHMEVSKALVFSEERVAQYRDSLYAKWTDQNKTSFGASKQYGLSVAQHIIAWMNQDRYGATRTMPKFTVITEDPSRWQPTPPAYMDGIEPHWNKIRPMIIDSATQFKPIPPPEFSLDPESEFYKELLFVYQTSKRIEAEGDQSDEIKMAQFWDCNPYVSVTRGHLMFATKKITPGAHWIGITKIAAQQANLDFNETVSAYTKTSIAIFDAFISCWDEKYRSNLIRPETLINQYIDEGWKPVLQTPPFPEYTSGHSVVSGASAQVLTDIFGADFGFDDTTELPYGLPMRHFDSFEEAAQEAAISRMYGGIHYNKAIVEGLKQGALVGQLVRDQLNSSDE